MLRLDVKRSYTTLLKNCHGGEAGAVSTLNMLISFNLFVLDRNFMIKTTHFLDKQPRWICQKSPRLLVLQAESFFFRGIKAD